MIKGKWAGFMGSDFLDLDLLAIMTAFLYLFYGQTPAAAFAFGQGLLMDLFSGGPHGLFTALYLIVFGGISVGSLFFNLQAFKGQVLLISLAVLLKKALFLVLLSAFSVQMVFSPAFFWHSLLSALTTGLIAPVLFSLFYRLKPISLKDVFSDSAED